MNKQQKEYLKHLTYDIIFKNNDIHNDMRAHGIPEPIVKRIIKAFNIIYEVNQVACK